MTVEKHPQGKQGSIPGLPLWRCTPYHYNTKATDKREGADLPLSLTGDTLPVSYHYNTKVTDKREGTHLPLSLTGDTLPVSYHYNTKVTDKREETHLPLSLTASSKFFSAIALPTFFVCKRRMDDIKEF